MDTETNFASDQFAQLGIAETPFLSELEKDPFLTGVAQGCFNELLMGYADMGKEISAVFMGLCWGSHANEKLSDEFRFLSALVRKVEL